MLSSFGQDPYLIFKQKHDNEQSLQSFLCQKFLFSKHVGNYVCKIHVQSGRHYAHNCTIESHNGELLGYLIWFSNAMEKLKVFFLPLEFFSFNESILLKRRKSKPVVEITNNTEEMTETAGYRPLSTTI